MLILFDVDATLINTSGSGMHALHDAGRDLYGPQFTIEGTEFAGRLDQLIISDLLDRNGLENSAEERARLRAGYARFLRRRLEDRTIARALPGVLPLVEALRRSTSATIGLLTGNYADTGSEKLRACGVDPDWFPIRVWADDAPVESPRRDHLPPVGMARYRELTGRSVPARECVIVGDTPHDVACAHAHGCRALAVATGSYSTAQLEKTGAERVVADLSHTTDILAWLISHG